MERSPNKPTENTPANDVWSPDSRTRIKICGITNIEDALQAVAAGADLLGFNFYRRSPRFIDPVAAREIIAELPADVVSVGVFVNESSPRAVLDIAHRAGIGAVQLHGEESPEYCASIDTIPVIKAFRVRPGFDPSVIGDYPTVPAVLLDAYSRDEHGGTGHTFDWEIARDLSRTIEHLFLAGGLGVDNVAEAVRLVQPFAMDACSRLEARPGIKDHSLVAKFIDAVRESSVEEPRSKYP